MTFTFFLGSVGSLPLIFTTINLQRICERKFEAFWLHRKSKYLSAQAVCETIYQLAVEEIISTYYPTVDNIDSQLDKMEEAILDKPLKSQLSEILVIRRKTSFLENTLEMILRVINQIINDQQTKLSNDAKKQIRSLYDRLSYPTE